MLRWVRMNATRPLILVVAVLTGACIFIPIPRKESSFDAWARDDATGFGELVQLTERMRGHRFLRPVRLYTPGDSSIEATLDARERGLAGHMVTLQALRLANPIPTERQRQRRARWERSRGGCGGAVYDPSSQRIQACVLVTRRLHMGPIIKRKSYRDDNVFAANILYGAPTFGGLLRSREVSRRIHPQRQFAEYVTVRTIVEALQDQHLSPRIPRGGPTTDAREARRALFAGDAELAAMGMHADDNGVRPLGPPASDVLEGQDTLATCKSAIDAALNAGLDRGRAHLRCLRHVDAPRLAATLYRKWKWAGVDAAHFAPPDSTAQVLHPERYLAGEHPETLRTGPLDGLLQKGLQRLGEDRVGEALVAAYFGGGAPLDQARQVASDLRGDRVLLLAPNGHTAAPTAIWWTRWSDEPSAERATALFADAHSALSGPERGLSLLRRFGADVLVVRGLPRELHVTLLTDVKPPAGADAGDRGDPP